MKRISNKIKILAVALVAALMVGFVAFDDQNFEIAKNLDIYYSLFRELNLYYVDQTDPGDLVKTSIDDMLSSLDPYTVYIPESKMEDYKFMTTGKYGGIGALIRNSGEYVIIAEPYEGFPAYKAGLKAGDKIVKVDGKSAKGNNTEEISELLKGDPNTEIKLTIERPGVEKELEKTVVRENIKIKSVPYYAMLNDSVGYIRLSSFTEDCSKEVKDAFIDLRDKQHMKSLVFDLRGNPGGLLMEAVAISNLFVPKGQEVVSTKGKVSQWNRTYNATNDPIDTKIPIALLVNQGSASASEIVSGVIQDLDRGVIIGKRTYGKGLVQTTRDLSYNSKLKLTTAKYYIPSGRCIQALDYTHRNADGSVGRVPDSLITAFKTKGGRTVYDGGGVMPDVEVEPSELNDIGVSLVSKGLIFDFATQFVLKHDSIPPVEKFKITDQIYDEFIAFLADKEFDYTMESDLLINDLESTLKKEKFHNNVDQELAALRKKLAHDKNADLVAYRGEISLMLHEEIASRFYYQTGRAKSSLIDDPTLEKAIEVLQNNKEYNNILTAGAMH